MITIKSENLKCSQINARSRVAVAMLCLGLLAVAAASRTEAASITYVDINPDNEGPIAGQAGNPACPDPCGSGRNGGRVNGLVAVPGDASTYFAASETGGLFKSTDGGNSWQHLDGHVPAQTWDVAVDSSGQRVYATSFYDGRVAPLTGFEMSTDGGLTWTHPQLTTPSTCAPNRVKQPSGFGVTIRPGGTEVFVGTNCGIARSDDAGVTWAQFDPTPNDSVTNSIWDIVALPGGLTYACGDDGLLLSTGNGQPFTWKNLNKPNPFPGGYCSLAVSPDDPGVVFVVFANPRSYGEVFSAQAGEFFEGHIDDVNAAAPSVVWTPIPYPDNDPNPVKKQRVPFVVTNKRSQDFDLWLGDGALWRVACHAQQTPNCPTSKFDNSTTPPAQNWFGSFTDHLGTIQDAHGDSGDLVFDPGASVDACPTLYSSDGGIHLNAVTVSPGCHNPSFRGANVGMHAFLLWDMVGVSQPGEDNEEIYFGTQDVGLYYTANAGVPDSSATGPSWIHGVGADLYDLEADATRVVVSTQNRDVVVGDPGFLNMNVVANGLANKDVDIPEFISQAGPGRYMMAISGSFDFPAGTLIPIGVRDITNIDVNPFGSPLGTWPSAKPPCHIKVGVGPAGPQPYVLAGTCLWPRTDFTADELWTYKGGNWVQIPPPPRQAGDPVSGGAGFGLIAVAAADPDRLYASIVRDGPPRMMRSNDGGSNWIYDAQLTELMSGSGKFIPYPELVGDGIYPYLQPLMVAFDPQDPNILVAGGNQSGVFYSSDGGSNWALLTDPDTPGTSGIPHLPRPMFAHFDHDKQGMVRVYLGTGRGVWRISISNQPPVAAICSNVNAECAGDLTAVSLDGTCSSDPDGDPISYMWSSPTCTFDDPTAPDPEAHCAPGSHSVSLVVSDPLNTKSQPDSGVIAIVDTLPPQLTVAVSPGELWPPNHKMRTIVTDLVAHDICDAAPAVKLVSITSNEPDNGKGDGNTVNDIQGAALGTDDRMFELRAERSGSGGGRVYAISYQAKDQSGNSTDAEVTVTVNHDQ